MLEHDACVAFYVSGYVSRSITRRRKCLRCKEQLINHDDAIPPPVCDSEEHTKLFQMADRGGLSVLSDYSYAVTTPAVQSYAATTHDEEATSRMMATPCQRSVFVTAAKNFVSKSTYYSAMMCDKCTAGHCNFDLFLAIVFNCFAKNELKRLKVPENEPQPRCLER